MSIKHLIKRNYYLYRFLSACILHLKRAKSIYGGGNYISNRGYGKINKDIIGQSNEVIIGKNSYFNKTKIRIRGNNNKITFGENCTIGPNCSFWMEGNNIAIIIGSHTSFTQHVHFCAQEDNVSIIVGEDCMFSNTITIRTSDSHPIYDDNGIRINNPRSVYIGNHVWVAPRSNIMKGANISDGAIIGSNTFVNNDIPENSLAVGSPAKVVKTKIHWTRETIF